MKLTAMLVLGSLAVAGTAFAQAASPTPTATPAVKATKAKTVTVRGEVKATDATASTVTLTVKGKEMTYTVDSSTKITKDGKTAALSDLTAGDKVTGKATEKDGKDTFTSLAVAKTKAAKPAAASPTASPAAK